MARRYTQAKTKAGLFGSDFLKMRRRGTLTCMRERANILLL